MDTLEELRFAVGDLVVYASHGIGRVADRSKRTVVLEFAERGLSVTLPIERAAECVRAVSTEVEIASIGRTLGEADEGSAENWQRRLKTTRSKVTVGEAAGLAEVVRDASRRDERATARKEPGKLSLTERQLYLMIIGVFTLGLGAITRSTAGGISTFAGIMFVIPPLMNVLPASWNNAISPYLPSSAGRAVFSLTHGSDSLAPWPGFAHFCGYAILTIGIAAVLLLRRDT